MGSFPETYDDPKPPVTPASNPLINLTLAKKLLISQGLDYE